MSYRPLGSRVYLVVAYGPSGCELWRQKLKAGTKNAARHWAILSAQAHGDPTKQGVSYSVSFQGRAD